MKKQIIALILIVLAAFFVTCGIELPEEDDPVVEYTDVVYNLNSQGEVSSVTVYLDGAKVPVTKSQRAITTDLAKMAYDYFEVVFVGRPVADQAIARASWELGQPAGISGVDRGPATNVGVDYSFTATKANLVAADASTLLPNTAGIAIMFVGRKDNKTLLGVGQIGDVDRSNPATTNGLPTALPSAALTTVKPDTTSVTFYIEAIKTGLLAGYVTSSTAESAGSAATNNAYGILTDSFDFDSADAHDSTDTTWPREEKSWRTKLGGVDYPMYQLPQKGDFDNSANTKTMATYKFQGAATTTGGYTNMATAIRFNTIVSATVKGIAIEKRFPRYMENGRYYQPKSNIDTDTTVTLNPSYYTSTAVAVGDAFKPDIPLIFTTKGSGIFSFYIEIPVYMLTKEDSTNGSLKSEAWRIRTGIGADLYCLDSGKSAGGCVLMSIGVDTLDDWLDIDWQWVD